MSRIQTYQLICCNLKSLDYHYNELYSFAHIDSLGPSICSTARGLWNIPQTILETLENFEPSYSGNITFFPSSRSPSQSSSMSTSQSSRVKPFYLQDNLWLAFQSDRKLTEEILLFSKNNYYKYSRDLLRVRIMF